MSAIASRSSELVERIVTSSADTTSAVDRVRLAVRRRAAEPVAVAGDPAIHGFLRRANTRDAVDPQRPVGSEGRRQRGVNRLRAAVYLTRIVQPPRHLEHQ